MDPLLEAKRLLEQARGCLCRAGYSHLAEEVLQLQQQIATPDNLEAADLELVGHAVADWYLDN